ncbi:sugar ABC transporter substrate-binding protein [Nakamurella leprariae]|uniref:Sugar ABC transporter substrate-binding protein n=1 Tax=Nakamurella leprariae TaxID=2803911 RepID=A0A938YE62_9ACTN|nr:sugar ABC transporter substrate-binding protein [Nakamurella leprariae]MBM9466113.1 sugar ABC transporter substrate-binding protein [Nakamurella leprariae]
MKRTVRTTVAAVAAVSALTLTACSTASSQQQSSSSAAASGGSSSAAAAAQPEPTVDAVSDLKIAYFSAGSSNQYLQAAIDEAKTFAGETGVQLDVFDGQFDAQVQFDQMQTALTSGKYNTFVVEPNDGNLVCNLLTRDAPAAGVMVSVFNLPICGRATNLGEETWQPGTVTYVGGQTLDVYQAWMDQIIEAYPDGGKVALISGPDLNANSICFFDAAKKLEDNGFEIVAQQTTDYTTPQAFQAAQTIVQANPDLDILMSNFSGMTRGVVQATAGTDIAVHDFGGDQWALDNVQSGALAGTIIMLPRQETRDALQAVVDLVEGEQPERFVNLAESDVLPNGTPFVTPENVGEYTAEY